MKQTKWLIISTTVQSLVVCMSVLFLEAEKLPFFIGSYILLLFVLSAITQRKGFVFLLCIILVLALSFLLIGFLKGLDTNQQILYILNHLFFTLSAVLAYFTVYLAKQLEDDNRKLKEKIDQLISYVGNTKLLTEQEFQERLNLILKAMERRGEGGYLIIFSLKDIPPHTVSTIYDTLTEKALETFRNDYDLVGQKDATSFMIFLQNTDAIGLKTALNRYEEKIKIHLKMDIDEMICEIQCLGTGESQVA